MIHSQLSRSARGDSLRHSLKLSLQDWARLDRVLVRGFNHKGTKTRRGDGKAEFGGGRSRPEWAGDGGRPLCLCGEFEETGCFT